jgi:hypothetical protein
MYHNQIRAGVAKHENNTFLDGQSWKYLIG